MCTMLAHLNCEPVTSRFSHTPWQFLYTLPSTATEDRLPDYCTKRVLCWIAKPAAARSAPAAHPSTFADVVKAAHCSDKTYYCGSLPAGEICVCTCAGPSRMVATDIEATR